MTKAVYRDAQLPYQDLYVYLLDGVLWEGDETFLGNDFIGNWVEGENSFLFFSKPSRQLVARLVTARPNLALESDYHFSYEEWQGGGLDPLTVDPFLIVPPWQKRGDSSGLITILLDPGVVFGNGLHPTTRSCLKALYLAAQDIPLGNVLDLGTGTGILALAAARLGAQEVLAVDLNPLCVKTATKNVDLNGLTGIIRVTEARAEDVVNDAADLIVANIHYAVIERLLEGGAFRKSAKLIISGLMRSQYREIKTRLSQCGFHLLHEWDHDMTWFTVLASRGPST
jgi:ribosomal protein L11 methyltransferase